MQQLPTRGCLSEEINAGANNAIFEQTNGSFKVEMKIGRRANREYGFERIWWRKSTEKRWSNFGFGFGGMAALIFFFRSKQAKRKEMLKEKHPVDLTTIE